MRPARRSVTAVGLALATVTAGSALLYSTPAHACGGCFGPSQTVQVVTDHRMVMAVHADESILWDQIRYTGAPSDFSWVLPVSGDVRIELATNEFFELLDQFTAPQVRAPFVNLSCPNYDNTATPGAFADASASDGGTGVMVIHQEVVGPYQTVTLRSTDANALTSWLETNSYVIPASIQPIIQYYVDRHMDFVALRLQPGEGVQAMQPIRIRYASSNMVLPLRMVSAGIADKVGISLWVFGNGRYESANFANGTIDPSQVSWNWTTNASNYLDVFHSTLQSLSSGRAWITEFADNSANFQYRFQYVYGATDPMAVEADWNLATANNTPGMWVTRLRTDLAAEFLDADLQLQASAWPTAVSNFIQVASGNEIGPRPTPNCPASRGRAQPVGTGTPSSATPPRVGTGTGHATPVGCTIAPAPGSSRMAWGYVGGFALALGSIIRRVRRRAR